MNNLNDMMAWIMGLLSAVVIFGWRYDKKRDNDRFDTIANRQTEGASRLAIIETKVANIETLHIQTLEDIKAQISKMGEDITLIKISLAGLPKRREDEN